MSKSSNIRRIFTNTSSLMLFACNYTKSYRIWFGFFYEFHETFQVNFINLVNTCDLSIDQQTFEHNALKKRIFLSKPRAIPKHRMKYFSSQHTDMDFFFLFFWCLRNSLVGCSHAASFYNRREFSLKALYGITWTELCFFLLRSGVWN